MLRLRAPRNVAIRPHRQLIRASQESKGPKMILFYGLPPQLYGQNGWIRRIAHIDSIFKEEERIYCYPARYTEKPVTNTPFMEKVTEKVSFFPCNFHYPLHNELFVSLLKECDFLYAHTAHSAPFLYPYYDSGKIITDLHGLPPEEERMFGYHNRGDFYEAYERVLIEKSHCVIGVTQAMYRHFHQKYCLASDRFICLPIMPDIELIKREERPEAKRIIYSGGIQAWQQVPKMLDAVKKLSARYEFLFLSQAENELRELARAEGINSLVRITSCKEAELSKYYAWADYGFCLREDSVVNRVSCPTKLMEYAISGIVPIIDSDEIGDFFAMGGLAIKLEEILNGDYFSKERLDAIRQANFIVMERLLLNARKSESILRNFSALTSSLTEAEWKFRFLDTESRVSLFPAAGQWQCGSLIRAEQDICFFHHKVALTLPQNCMHDVKYHIAPIPAILQQPPIAYAVHNNGTKIKIPCTHNFIKQGKHWVALAGYNTVTIEGSLLQDIYSVVVDIHIHIAGSQVQVQDHADSRLSWRKRIRHCAEILLPVGTKRRKWVKKLSMLRIMRKFLIRQDSMPLP